MNRQDICSSHYSEPQVIRTSQRPFRLILRDMILRVVLGELRGGTA
jgi:hypothetical protein